MAKRRRSLQERLSINVLLAPGTTHPGGIDRPETLGAQAVNKRHILPAAAAVFAVAVLAVPILGQQQVGVSQTRIEALSKVGRGAEQVVRDEAVQCPTGARTRNLLFKVRAEIAPARCDERCSKNLLNGYLYAEVLVRRREVPSGSPTPRGRFEGRWQLLNRAGVKVAEGTMRGVTGASAFNWPEDENPALACAAPGHYEGVMEGVSLVDPCRGPILASIQGEGLDPRLATFRIRAEGTLTAPCSNTTASTSNEDCCSG